MENLPYTYTHTSFVLSLPSLVFDQFWEVVPNEESQGLSYCLRTGSWPIWKAVSKPVVVWSFFGCFSVVFRLFGTLKPNQSQCYNGWTQPPVCLPSVYLMSLYMTKSPRLSPSIFTCSNWVETGGRNGLGMRLYVYSKSLTRSAVIRSLKL